MNRPILTILAILLMAGMGLGGFMLSSAPAKASEAEVKDGAPKIAYIAMDPIILPIIDRDGITQTISLVVSIQVNDPVNAEEVKANLPKLADAYLSDMYGTLTKKAAMEGGVIKVSMLKARLVGISQRVMGKDKINDVLLQVLQQHPV